MFIDLPFDIGDILYVDFSTLPTGEINYNEEEPPKYLKSRIVSVRKNSRGLFVKISVWAGWICKYDDPETGPDDVTIAKERCFTYPVGAIGKTIFLKNPEEKNAV